MDWKAKQEKKKEQPPKKDWSRASRIWDEIKEKEAKEAESKKQPSVTEKILKGEKIEGVPQATEAEIKKSAESRDKLMNELRRITEKQYKGDSLTDEEKSFIKKSLPGNF